MKQGIEDGFLAPYKVVRIDLDKDLLGWRPEKGQVDDARRGDRGPRSTTSRTSTATSCSPSATKLVAERISSFLHGTDPMHKTIVFCEDIDHAERMRQALVNVPANAPLVQADHRYVMRITGDNDEGKAQLDNFIDPKQPYPVIATTSKLMTTGVDAQTCKVIVLDQRIQSMTEFKQIIGRGTRIAADYGKFFFTILDFRKATELFADPDWDGPPIQIYEVPEGDEDVTPPGPPLDGRADRPTRSTRSSTTPTTSYDDAELTMTTDRHVYVVSGVEVHVVAERVQYYDQDGKLITESLQGLHPPHRARGVRDPRRVPEAVEGEPTASRPSSTSC